MLPLDPGIRADGRVSNKVINHLHPRLMARQVIVELWGQLSYLGQPTPRNIREVMVFVVIAHVKGDVVEWAVVAVRLEAFVEHVVLRDEMSSHWVQPHCQQGSPSQVEHTLGSKIVTDQKIAGELNSGVKYLQEGGSLGVGDDRPQGIEERLKTHPDHLAKGGAEQPCLKAGGDVSVKLLISLEFVVLQMVPFEGH